ncbi:MAG: PaaI family thioesterase [Sphingobium sp.]
MRRPRVYRAGMNRSPPAAIAPETLKAEGWSVQQDLAGFSDHIAPFWFLAEGEALSTGFFVEAGHCNEHLGTLHGGAAMTFADISGGFATARALGHMRCATLQLQCHFTAVARIGEFVRCDVEIVRRTREILFLRGLMRTADRPVLSFDGIWKILTGRPSAG